MGSEMSQSRHCPFSCAVSSCHMSLSTAFPIFSRSLPWLPAPPRGEDTADAAGEPAALGRCTTLTNCGITLMALAAPALPHMHAVRAFLEAAMLASEVLLMMLAMQCEQVFNGGHQIACWRLALYALLVLKLPA